KSVVHDSLPSPGPPHDEWNAAGGAVGGGVLGIDAQLSQVLPVVGGDDDRRLVPHTRGLESLGNLSDVIVDVTDGGVVAINQAAHGGPVRYLSWVPWIPRILPVIIHADF